MNNCVVLQLLTFFSAPLAAAGSIEFTGHLGMEAQYFDQSPAFAGQRSGNRPSVVTQPELYWKAANSRSRVGFVGFARAGDQDDHRNHADIRELYWLHETAAFSLKLGIDKVFWGVTESRHLVNVINQTDSVECIDQEEKLGQPMINIDFQRAWGRLSAFWLPYFRERTFADTQGRLRSETVVDTNDARYESGARRRHQDVALRYSHYFGDVDLGVYAFKGTDRDPLLIPAPDGQTLVPYYRQMSQLGVDVQYTRDAWLWKLEAIARHTRDDDFIASVAGFEYSFFQVFHSRADLGVLMEHLYDRRDLPLGEEPFDDDIFIGARLTLNDARDTSFLAGAIVDRDSGEHLLSLESERRLGENISVELDVKIFGNTDKSLRAYERDDHFRLKVLWYF